MRTQNKIEDLQAQIDKYKSYGGFKKGKKPKKIVFKTAKVKKFKVLKMKLSPAPKAIKFKKIPKIKLTIAKRKKQEYNFL